MQQIGLVMNGYWWMDFLQIDLCAFSSPPQNDDPKGILTILINYWKYVQGYIDTCTDGLENTMSHL